MSTAAVRVPRTVPRTVARTVPRTVARTRRLVSAAMLVVLVGTGCGSGRPPQEWAGQVCDALTPWRTRIGELNAQAQASLSAASTPAQAKASLLDLLAGGQAASETARTAVVSAGTPDVSGGEQIAGRFAASLQQAREAYAHARTDLQALSTDDAAAFYDAVAAIMSTLNDEYTGSALDTKGLESVELRDAFDKVDRCQ
jgi:hypothetical protein